MQRRMQRNRMLLTITAAALASAGFAHASVIYVNASAAGGNNGTSWADAYVNLQSALAAAQSGDEIWVAVGVYKPAPPGGPRTASFAMPPGVAILGGFAGTEDSSEERDFLANVTILSGDLNGNDPPAGGDNSFHVVRANNVTSGGTLDGFTVTAGNSNGGTPPVTEFNGAGILIAGGSPIIRNCTIQDNRAWSGTFGGPIHNGGSGGGADISGGASVTFEACRFTSNRAGHGGGGQFVPPGNGGIGGAIRAVNSNLTVTNCEFSGNLAGGGGFSSEQNGGSGGSGGAIALSGGALTLNGCTFHGNIAGAGANSGFDSGPSGLGGSGGAIWTSAATAVVIHGGSCDNNQSGGGSPGNGGALSLSSTTPISVSSMTFSGNFAASDLRSGGNGGAIHCASAMTVSDCLFSANRAGNTNGFWSMAWAGSGGAITSTSGTLTIDRCTFLDNRAGDAGAAIAVAGSGGAIHASFATIHNSAFLGNLAGLETGGPGSEDGAGGAIYGQNALTLVNCLLAGNATQGNSGSGNGGAIIFIGSSNISLINCTLSQNQATALGGGVYLALASIFNADNCIFWNNSDIGGTDQTAQIEGFTAGDSIDFSCVQGLTGSFGGTGNIGSNPHFSNALSGDFRLSSGSPCIDSADNSAVPAGITLDIDGNPRFLDDPLTSDTGVGTPPIVDMGAAEFDPCIADIDSDRDVDLADLAVLLSQFAVSGPDLAGDLDQDGDVDLADLAVLLSQFGQLCP